MCTPHSGWAQAGMAWGEGGQRLVSVVILARVTAAGILFKSKPKLGYPNIPCNNRLKIQNKSYSYLYPEPGEARPGTGGII